MLMGCETEYALTMQDRHGGIMDRGTAVSQLLTQITHRQAYLLNQQQASLFLGNGARVYGDYGGHPEYATPECDNPTEVVRYVKAGDSILAGAAVHLARRGSVGQVILTKCNVDYSGTGKTWGCHESYLTRTPLQRFPPHLIPHLVSRLIYTGSGGFNNLRPDVQFLLSPRVPHLLHDISDESTRGRGIFHTKNESLASQGHHRLHILTGESNCSELSMWLKMGTTALVVSLIDAGVRLGDAVSLASPCQAMLRFASDPTCQTQVKLANGKLITAVAMQRHYLAQVKMHVHRLPAWAPAVCEGWEAMLDRLEASGVEAVKTMLDWGIKYALLQDYCHRRGEEWDILHSRPASAYTKTQKVLCRELGEIDTRYAQLGPQGIFTALDSAGVLSHQVPGSDHIADAMEYPPATGRAYLRGAFIRKHAGHNGRYQAEWNAIFDMQSRKVLDLSAPFETQEHWREMPKGERRC
jgi:proteasome accessory factor A